MMRTNQFFYAILCLCLSALFNLQAQEKNSKTKNNTVEHTFNKTSGIRIEMVASNILRISIVPEGGTFQNSGLNHYGLINSPESAAFKPEITKTDQVFSAKNS